MNNRLNSFSEAPQHIAPNTKVTNKQLETFKWLVPSFGNVYGWDSLTSFTLFMFDFG